MDIKEIAERYDRLTNEGKKQFWDGYFGATLDIKNAEAYELLADMFKLENKIKEEGKMEEKGKEVKGEGKDLVVAKKREIAITRHEMPSGEWMETVKYLHASGMFTDLRSVAQAITKAQCGRELGFPPFYSLQNFFILPGKPPASSGQVMAALIKRSGFDYMTVKHDDTICTIRFFGLKGQTIGEASFTYAEADKVVMKTQYGNKKLTDKSNWKNYRQDMLYWRAMARGARRHCPDVIAGLYLRDEIDIDDTPIKEDSDLSAFKVEPVAKLPPESPKAQPVKTRKDILAALVGKYGKVKIQEVKTDCKITGKLLEISDEEFKKLESAFDALTKDTTKKDETKKDDKPKEEKKKEEKSEMTKDEKKVQLEKLKKDFGVAKIKEVKESMKIEGKLVDLPEKEFNKLVKQVGAK